MALRHGIKSMISLAVLLGTASAVNAAPTVYIPLGSGNQVIAVDGATDQIVANYSGVENPHGLVATPDGEFLVAGSLKENPAPAGASADTPTSKLFLVHPEHGHVMSTIPVVGWTHHQAITPDGRFVISTHATRGGISVLDLNSNKIVKTIPTGPAPNYAVFTQDGASAYVSNSGNGTISQIDVGSWEVTKTLEAGPAPEHLVLSRDEQTIYAINPRAGTVSAVSVDDGKVVESYKVGKNVHGLDLGEDGKTLFVSSKADETLTAIDTETGKQRSITLTPSPYHLNVITGTGKVYVSSSKKPLIWVVDQKDLSVSGTIDLPAGEAHQMAVVGE